MDKAKRKRIGIIAISLVCVISLYFNARTALHSESVRQHGVLVMWVSVYELAQSFADLYEEAKVEQDLLESDAWLELNERLLNVRKNVWVMTNHDTNWSNRTWEFRMPFDRAVEHTNNLIVYGDAELLLDFISRYQKGLEEFLEKFSEEMDTLAGRMTVPNTRTSNRRILRYIDELDEDFRDERVELRRTLEQRRREARQERQNLNEQNVEQR